MLIARGMLSPLTNHFKVFQNYSFIHIGEGGGSGAKALCKIFDKQILQNVYLLIQYHIGGTYECLLYNMSSFL